MATDDGDDLRLEVKEITPELAAGWLAGARPNRKIRPTFSRQLADDIRNGRWTLNGQPFRFDTEGRMVDGQHRALAVVQAGLPIRSVIVTGVAVAAQDTIDEGLARRFSDILRIRGEKYYAIIAAATSWRVHYVKGTMTSRCNYRTSIAGLSEVLLRYPSIRLGAEWSGKAGAECPLSPSLSTFCYSIFDDISSDDRSEFLSGLVSGEYLNAEHPVLMLRNALLKNKAKSIGRAGAAVLLAWTIKAWNAYRDSEPLKLLKWAPWQEEFPVAR